MRRPRKAFACSAVWSVRTVLELLGVSTSLHVLALRCSPRLLPSAGMVLRSTPKLVLAGFPAVRATGFPCCCCLPLHHAAASTRPVVPDR